MEKTLSIHPRNWTTGNGNKTNTSQKKSAETITRIIQGISGHLKVHPRDAQSLQHLKKVETLR